MDLSHSAIQLAEPSEQIDPTCRQSHNRRNSGWRNSLASVRQDHYDVIADLSHETRTSLCVIREYASLLQDGVLGMVNPAQTDAMEIVCGRADEICLLMDIVLFKTRIAAGEFHPTIENCPLHEVLQEPVAHLVERPMLRQLQLHTEIADALPDVRCDRTLVRQILLGLWQRVARVADLHTAIRLSVTHEQQSRRVVIRFTGSCTGDQPTTLSDGAHATSHVNMQRIDIPQGDLVLDAVSEFAALLGNEVHIARSADNLFGLELSLPVSADSNPLSAEVTER